MTYVDDLYEPNDREPNEPDDEPVRTDSVTAADIAEHLTGSDNDYTEALDGWPSLHAVGDVLHIKFTPAVAPTTGSGTVKTTVRYFEARVVEVTPPPVSPIGHRVLDVPMNDDDSGAATIREYLVALARVMWEHGEGVSGKRPFGNSGWDWDVYTALTKAGLITGQLDEYGNVVDANTEKGDELIAAALKALATPPPA